MRHILKCGSCGSYGLSEECDCGSSRARVQPPKWSPEDKYGSYRRKYKAEHGLLVLFLLALVACTPVVQTPGEAISGLEAACESCAGGDTVVSLSGTLYTTTENAVCLQREQRLTCGTCGCDLLEYRAEIAGDVTCSFLPANDSLEVFCE